jgi:hypothetical protein
MYYRCSWTLLSMKDQVFTIHNEAGCTPPRLWFASREDGMQDRCHHDPSRADLFMISCLRKVRMRSSLRGGSWLSCLLTPTPETNCIAFTHSKADLKFDISYQPHLNLQLTQSTFEVLGNGGYAVGIVGSTSIVSNRIHVRLPLIFFPGVLQI